MSAILNPTDLDLATKEAKEEMQTKEQEVSRKEAKNHFDNLLDDMFAGLNALLNDDDFKDLDRENFKNALIEHMQIDKPSQLFYKRLNKPRSDSEKSALLNCALKAIAKS